MKLSSRSNVHRENSEKTCAQVNDVVVVFLPLVTKAMMFVRGAPNIKLPTSYIFPHKRAPASTSLTSLLVALARHAHACARKNVIAWRRRIACKRRRRVCARLRIHSCRVNKCVWCISLSAYNPFIYNHVYITHNGWYISASSDTLPTSHHTLSFPP